MESVVEFTHKFFQNIYKSIFKDSVTVIIPAYNEEKTIKRVVEIVRKARKVDEIMVVDDGSKDRTFSIASKLGVTVLGNKKNAGKGAAMKLGLGNAKGNIIAFVDADLESLTPQQVELLINPILEGRADFVKSYFSHYKSKTGTSIFLYRPLLKHLFMATSFVHPVSGQIAGRRKFFEGIEFRNDYGIDISILIDAIQHDLRIEEVCLGKLKHRVRTPGDVEKMADTIIMTILEKANVLKKAKIIKK